MVESVIAGDSREWRICAADYFRDAPAGCDAKAFLRTSEAKLQELSVEMKDDLIVVKLVPATSAELPTGEGFLIVRLEKGEDFAYRQSQVLGRINVLPGIEHGDFDSRSEAQQCLEQAKKALADYTQGRSRVRSYTIGTRSLTFNSAQELMDLVKYWQQQVYLEECAKTGDDPRRMLTEFVP